MRKANSRPDSVFELDEPDFFDLDRVLPLFCGFLVL